MRKLLMAFRENEMPKATFVITPPALYGQYQELKKAIDSGLKPDHRALNYAAKAGNLEGVKYLESLGVKPNYLTLAYAASNQGNKEMVKYIAEELGARVNDVAILYADDAEILSYLTEQKSIQDSLSLAENRVDVGLLGQDNSEDIFN